MLCEACGHPLNLHDPCNAPISKRKSSTGICGCPAFQPEDAKRRAALLTDHDYRLPPKGMSR